MRRPLRTRLERFADYAVPWGVGIFLAMVVLDEEASPALLALALAAVQGVALRWRRRQPERVMAVAIVAGLGYQLLVPEIVLPIAGFFAIESLAATRPPRVSL